jgi:hypothetical protein
METNVFLTTAYEIECRAAVTLHPSSFILHPSPFTLQQSVEIEGEAPLIVLVEAFDA